MRGCQSRVARGQEEGPLPEMVEGGGLASWRTEEIEVETESIAHVKDGGDKGLSFRPSAF